MPLGENMLKNGFISADQLETALKEQEKSPDEKLGQILLRLGFASAEQIEKSL